MKAAPFAGELMWQPSQERQSQSAMSAFLRHVNQSYNLNLQNYEALHQWSVTNTEPFWSELAKFVDVKWRQQPQRAYLPPPDGEMLGAQWFADSQLNFAENLLFPKLGSIANDTGINSGMINADSDAAIIGVAEGGETVQLSWSELHRQVAQCSHALKQFGVTKGDRVAAVVANVPETIVAMLATASLGAIWSSCSPDFGVGGIIDRFGQIDPKVLFYCQSYQYAGKVFDCSATIAEVIGRLPSLNAAVAINHLHRDESGVSSQVHSSVQVISWSAFLKNLHFIKSEAVKTESSCAESGKAENIALHFTPTAFDHPLYILFSSGTTGVPKCIVHSAGGTLLQHKKELLLHSDIRANDRLFYFTTCGWMMWNWMVSALSVGASLVVYEGAVNVPDMSALWRLVDNLKVTCFGTSPKFIATCMAQDYQPASQFKFSKLKTLLSTGSPLLPEHFQWVYDSVKSDIHLASISGGTDIVSCFMLGNPLAAVYCSEIQGPGLGMKVEVWDEAARRCAVGEKGELVCTAPFVSMPLGFWGDKDGSKFKAAYFEYFKNQQVWRHGDYISQSAHGGFIVFGRSDTTLNPGGIRIGTAEIYRVVEALEFVEDSLVCGVQIDGDVQVVLFIKNKPGMQTEEQQIKVIKSNIRRNLTPRHVPHFIFSIEEIPYTRSGKKVELAVQNVLEGQQVKNISALKNPEALAGFEKYRQMIFESNS